MALQKQSERYPAGKGVWVVHGKFKFRKSAKLTLVFELVISCAVPSTHMEVWMLNL